MTNYTGSKRHKETLHEALKDIDAILRTAIKAYSVMPSEELEKNIKEVKKEYDRIKQKHDKL